MPLKLTIENSAVKVHRLIGAINIPLAKITNVEKVPHRLLDNSIRVFGSGGVFGYLGIFKNDSIGRYTMYATELNNLIIIRTHNKTYVLSCEKPDIFIDDFLQIKYSV